ncbi:hypothetical protein KLNKPBOH_02979 [Aeromonas veronii]
MVILLIERQLALMSLISNEEIKKSPVTGGFFISIGYLSSAA